MREDIDAIHAATGSFSHARLFQLCADAAGGVPRKRSATKLHYQRLIIGAAASL